jgi:hypothetical protein
VGLTYLIQAELLDQSRDVSETGPHIRGKRLKLRIDGGIQGLTTRAMPNPYYTVFAMKRWGAAGDVLPAEAGSLR